MAYKDQAALVFGFFQMAGYNRYDVSPKANGKPQIVDFLDVLQRLDKGWAPARATTSSRELKRPAIAKTRPAYVTHLDQILPYGRDSRVEAEIAHEYLPFSLAKLKLDSCDRVTEDMENVCGLVVAEKDGSCVCWVNMPTFKSNSVLIRFLGKLAALIKIPSRVTTFVEMALMGSRNGTLHVKPLRGLEGANFELATCDIGEEACRTSFSFPKGSRLLLFRGAPASIPDVLDMVSSV